MINPSPAGAGAELPPRIPVGIAPQRLAAGLHRRHAAPGQPGRNVISVEIESRRAPAALRLDGEILLWSGERVRVDSGADWLAEPAPPFDRRYDWTEPKYPDLRLATTPSCFRAPPATRPTTTSARSTDQVLTTPFAGHWLRHAEARSVDTTWFRGEWHLPGAPDRCLDPAGRRPLVRPLRQRPARLARLSRQPGPRLGRLDPRLALGGPTCPPRPSCSTPTRSARCSSATASSPLATAT